MTNFSAVVIDGLVLHRFAVLEIRNAEQGTEQQIPFAPLTPCLRGQPRGPRRAGSQDDTVGAWREEDDREEGRELVGFPPLRKRRTRMGHPEMWDLGGVMDDQALMAMPSTAA